MKDLYKIHEIARLFHLHPDTLRYYEEKGLLHPVRGESNYRMYTIQDVCTLNVIRSLRELDLPTEEIRAYLERRSVAETLDLLDHQEALLEEKLASLRAAQQEARKVMDAAKVSIEQERKQAELQFRNEVSAFALDIAGKVVRGQMQDRQAQARLVDSMLDEMEKQN